MPNSYVNDAVRHVANEDEAAAKATTGIALIAAERRRQVDVEGWTAEDDDAHLGGTMAIAAACYATCGTDARVVAGLDDEDAWPFDPDWDKRPKHDRIRQLVIAGALIAAEIDRVQRLPPCRRCSECQGQDHHWMPSANYHSEAQPAWECKHCEHSQYECPECGGDCVGECEVPF